MKKFLILFLLLCIACIGYSDTLNVRVIVNSMDIVSPDGDERTELVRREFGISAVKIMVAFQVVIEGLLKIPHIEMIVRYQQDLRHGSSAP